MVDDADWELYDSSMNELTLLNVEYDARREFYLLTAEEELTVGQTYYVNTVSYTGPVDNTLLGIYWSSYETNGVTE